MSSNRKRVIGEEDRFRQLPDEILRKIFSLLPSEEAARICILSKSWRHFFLKVPKLIARSRDANPEKNQEMFDFINRWIISTKDPVDEFRFINIVSDNEVPAYLPEESVFCSWLTMLLFRRIKVLELTSNVFIVPPEPVHPPEDFFRSETLVHLRISGDTFVLKIPGLICCPCLKTLYLEELVVENESGDFRFTGDGYPKLEELCLKDVNFYRTTSKKDVKPILTISLETLEKLVVDSDWEVEVAGRVDIHTQHLKHFQFTVKEDTEVNFRKCQSLVYADIYQFSSGESYTKLLRQINNVKTLQLSDRSPQDYNGVAGSFPQFIHLTHLNLRSTAHQSVWCLLQHAPNLEVLDCEMSCKPEDYLPHKMCHNVSLEVLKKSESLASNRMEMIRMMMTLIMMMR